MTEKSSLMKVKKFIVKVTSYLQFFHQIRPILSYNGFGEGNGQAAVLPKGHFAIVAVKGNEPPSRFVVELKYLRSPALLKLLKEAEEEYGFHQGGALVVPCKPEELQKILED